MEAFVVDNHAVEDLANARRARSRRRGGQVANNASPTVASARWWSPARICQLIAVLVALGSGLFVAYAPLGMEAGGSATTTTDGGVTWTSAQVPDAATLDFRAVVAFSAAEAFLMSAGPSDQSRIYHTSDGGKNWVLQFTNTNPKAFFDSMAFWDSKHGIVLGDPIPDESGKLKFEVLLTDDGQTWKQIPPTQLPEAMEGEG